MKVIINIVDMGKKLLDGLHSFQKSKEVVLRITKYCNQSCVFCLTDIDNSTHIPYDDIINEIEDLATKYADYELNFVITGGEPELHPDFFRIIQYLYEHHYFITVQSNAVILGNGEKFRQLEKYMDKISFFISYHAHIEKVYNAVTGSTGQYELATQGIKNILKNGKYKELNINIVLNIFNIRFLTDYFYFIGTHFSCINTKFSVNISLMTNIYKYSYAGKLLIQYSDVVVQINKAQSIIEKYEIQILRNFGGPCDMPFCIAQDVFYYQERLTNESRDIIDREKLDSCVECKFEKNCNGVLTLYLEKFGKEEFIPIRKTL